MRRYVVTCGLLLLYGELAYTALDQARDRPGASLGTRLVWSAIAWSWGMLLVWTAAAWPFFDG